MNIQVVIDRMSLSVADKRYTWSEDASSNIIALNIVDALAFKIEAFTLSSITYIGQLILS
jgi:hypothetical protein